ncbi:12875_t:CDS:2, partial [Gigaspora rosea]
NEVTPVHEHLFTRLSNTDVDRCIGIIDLSSDKYIILESETRRKFVLSLRETVTHDQWVEVDHVRGHIASGITDITSRLSDITISIYHLPVDFEVEITRSERQSIAKMGRNIFFESGKWRFAVNIADKYLEINGLIKEKGENYHPIIKAKIPLENKVEEFVHALLVLR